MPQDTAPASHDRQHGSLLADAERRLLQAIAVRLPRWILADHLSAIGLAGTAIAAGAFVLAGGSRHMLLLVPVGLAINWFGDSLDGTVARVRDEQRPRYGYYLDHVLDICGMALLLAGMAASPYMSSTIALLVFGAYVALMAESFLAAHAVGVFRLSVWSIGPTELRVLLAIGVLRLLYAPAVTLAGEPWPLFDVGGACAVAGMAAAFVYSAIRNAAALSRAEPLPRRPARRLPHRVTT
jgi:phosphatidylglycerophosphate synthase